MGDLLLLLLLLLEDALISVLLILLLLLLSSDSFKGTSLVTLPLGGGGDKLNGGDPEPRLDVHPPGISGRNGNMVP